MLRVNSLSGFGGKAPRPIIVEATDGGENNTPGTSHTVSALSIGSAFVSRVVVAALMIDDNDGPFADPITSVTIGGVTATRGRLESLAGGSVTEIAAIYAAVVPTGTTADVVCNYDQSLDRVRVQTHALRDCRSVTATDHDGSNGLTFDTLSGTVDVEGGGFLIAAHMNRDIGDSPVTWTGITERTDGLIGALRPYSHAYDDPISSAISARTVTVDPTGTSARGSLAVCAYR